VSIENRDMPAMPWDEIDPSTHQHGIERQFSGLTKRELFAAMAMQGLMGLPIEMSHEMVASSAVTQADALLAELAKKAGAE